MRKYRNYTDKNVIQYAKEVTSAAGLLRKLNLVIAGGNYAHLKKTIQRLNIDTAHWTGQAWNAGLQLKDWSSYSKVCSIRRNLIKIVGHKCKNCKLEMWMNEKIPVELHHIDGNRTNNNIDNLEFLCCNCHALTVGWRQPNKSVM